MGNSSKNELEFRPIKKSLSYAISSFLIGSGIFISFYWTKNVEIALFGLLFIVIGIILNGAFLIKLMMKMTSEKANKRKYLSAVLILIINIPIAIIYFNIVMNIIFINVAMD